VGILQLLAGGPLVQARLGELLGIEKAAMVPFLDQLEAQLLVERRPHPDDGRAFAVYLKPHGISRLREAEAINQEASEELFAALSDAERRSLHGILSKMVCSAGSPLQP
jgi:DNA-binding MarR family transcriptional regulator